ncbi:MAG: hypothetical protein OXE53_09490 [Deltaproteobacteria bacterium]|nr:hypothetical protein [Deltaproteobacteria bacterium]
MSCTLVWQVVLLASGAVCFSAMGATAEQPASLYRTGTPVVLTPEAKRAAVPAEVPSVSVREAFRRFYQQAGSPRLAVFWNRRLDDRLREMEAESRVVFARTTAGRKDDGGTLSASTSEEKLSVSLEARRDSAPTSPLSEASGLRFQSGFLRPFLEQGARMIDRNMILRLTGTSRALADSSRPVRDRQLIEVLALKDHADFLIQIMPAPSDESGSGAVFHVSIIEIKSGRILGSFVQDATLAVERTSRTWKAVRGGFVEVEETETPRVDLDRMGRMLASRAMAVLSRT